MTTAGQRSGFKPSRDCRLLKSSSRSGGALSMNGWSPVCERYSRNHNQEGAMSFSIVLMSNFALCDASVT
eukprot:1152482-Pelagomonas_calceolata.AAC.5